MQHPYPLNYQLTRFYESSKGLSSPLQSRPLYVELSQQQSRYSDFEFLGEGGFKSVCRVFDHKLGHPVALARLKSGLGEEWEEAFLGEARLTAHLKHPNIIPVFDIGLLDGKTPYFTLELKRGHCLTAILQKIKNGDSLDRECYSLHQLLNIFLKVTDAVAYAHAENVLHLDLKPDNIQVGPFGEVLVLDWGLGTFLGGEQNDEFFINQDLVRPQLSEQLVRGTPGFMAPEQLQNQKKSPQTDIYGLGALLYTILTGDFPLCGSINEIAQKTIRGDVTPAAQACPDRRIPQGLSAIVARAMEVKPQDRYASVLDLQHDLNQYLQGFAPSAEKAGFVRETSLFIQRHRQPLAILTMGGVLLMAILLFFFFKMKETRDELSQALRRTHEILNSYRTEKENFDLFVRESERNDLLIPVIKLLDFDFFKTPQDSLRKASQLLERIALTHSTANFNRRLRIAIQVIQQQPQKVLQLMKPSDVIFPKLYKTCQDYAPKALDNKLLPIEDLLGFVSVYHQDLFLFRFAYYDAECRQDKSEHARLVQRLIEICNPQWKDGIFIYDPSARSLQISGSYLATLGSSEFPISVDTNHPMAYQTRTRSVNFLQGLSLRRLDLQGTYFYDLSQIDALQVESLNLEKTHVQDLTPLKNFKKLKEVTLTASDFSAESLKVIPSSIRVILK